MNPGLPGVGGQTEKKFTERKEMYKGRCGGVFCVVLFLVVVVVVEKLVPARWCTELH